MNAYVEVGLIPALQWLISKSEPMLEFFNEDESLRDEPLAIPNSGIFEGRLPGRMAQEIKQYLRASAVDERSCRDTVVFNFTMDGTPYAVTFGALKSTATSVKFQFCPNEW